MPTKFNMSTEGRRVDLDPTIPVQAPVYDDSASEAEAAYNTYNPQTGGGNRLSDMFGGNPESVLGDYAVEAGDIVEQTANYASERERIMSGITSATDKETVGRYFAELGRLRRGEIQGALDPLSAAARINALTKKYINRNPGLALKFRQIHNGILDDVPQVSGFSGKELDPDMEAMNDLVKAAAMKGILPAEEQEIRRQEAISAQQVSELEAKKRLGTLAEADIAKTLQQKTFETYSKIWPVLSKASTDPRFKGTDWALDLGHARNQVEQVINTTLAQAQIEGKMVLSGEFQTRLKNDLLAPFEQLLKIAPALNNPATRAQAAKDLKAAMQTNDWINIRKNLGPLVSIYEGNIPELFAGFSSVAGQLKSGMRGELETLAAHGDVQTRIILGTIDGMTIDQIFADGLVATTNGQPLPPSGMPVMDKMNFQNSLNVALLPTTKPELKAKVFTSLMQDINAFEALSKRPDAIKQIALVPGAVEALKDNAAKQLLQHRVDANSVNQIKFDAMQDNPISVTPFRDDGKYKQAGMYGDLTRARTPSATETLVTKMNEQYKVFEKLIGRSYALKWAAETVDELRLSFNTDYLEKSMKSTKHEEKKANEKSQGLDTGGPRMIVIDGQQIDMNDPAFVGLSEDEIRASMKPATE
jgi:hypothetical protein